MSKEPVKNMEYKCTSKEVLPSKASRWHQKIKDPMLKRSGAIYKYSCDRVECDEEYIGESSRNFVERFKEHQKAPSPIFDHYTTIGHNNKVEKFQYSGERGPEP